VRGQAQLASETLLDAVGDRDARAHRSTWARSAVSRSSGVTVVGRLGS
jgi:hypothetical protein